MGLKIKLLVLLVGFVFFAFVFRAIKKNNMRPSYAVLWLLVGSFLISVPVLEFFYGWIAHSVIGIADARHIIYIVLIGFLLTYIFYLTMKISQMSDRLQELISFTAILEQKIDEKQS